MIGKGKDLIFFLLLTSVIAIEFFSWFAIFVLRNNFILAESQNDIVGKF